MKDPLELSSKNLSQFPTKSCILTVGSNGQTLSNNTLCFLLRTSASLQTEGHENPGKVMRSGLNLGAAN